MARVGDDLRADGGGRPAACLGLLLASGLSGSPLLGLLLGRSLGCRPLLRSLLSRGLLGLALGGRRLSAALGGCSSLLFRRPLLSGLLFRGGLLRLALRRGGLGPPLRCGLGLPLPFRFGALRGLALLLRLSLGRLSLGGRRLRSRRLLLPRRLF